jgi:hypothetical protein
MPAKFAMALTASATAQANAAEGLAKSFIRLTISSISFARFFDKSS